MRGGNFISELSAVQRILSDTHTQQVVKQVARDLKTTEDNIEKILRFLLKFVFSLPIPMDYLLVTQASDRRDSV